MAGEEPLKNVSQEWFCRKLLGNNGNATKAYEAAYPNASYDTAQAHAHEMLYKPAVVDRLAYLLETEYAPDDVLAKDLDAFRTATKPLVIDGQIHDVPDWNARHSGIQTILKLRGKLVDSQIKIDARSVHNYTGNSQESASAMLSILQEMKEIRAQIKRDKLTMTSEPLASNTLETPVAQGLEQDVQSSENKK